MRSIGIMMKLLTFSTVLLSLTIGCGKKQDTDQQTKVEQYQGYKTIMWSDVPACPKLISAGSFMVGTGAWIGPALGKSPCDGPIRVQEGTPTHATIMLLEDGLAKYEAEIPPGCKLEPQLA